MVEASLEFTSLASMFIVVVLYSSLWWGTVLTHEINPNIALLPESGIYFFKMGQKVNPN